MNEVPTTSEAGGRPDPLRMLDLAQTGAAAVIARVEPADWHRPTPCDEWSVMNVIDKLTASTIMFTSFGRRDSPDPSLDLINPRHIVGDDPLGAYLAAAATCRVVWRDPGALDGMASSTIGPAKARAVLNARIFDTTVLTWDIATACRQDHLITDELASYVIRVAQALVPAVRAQSPERYRASGPVDADAAVVEQLISPTGRSWTWSPPR